MLRRWELNLGVVPGVRVLWRGEGSRKPLLKADVRIAAFVAEEVDVCVRDLWLEFGGGEELRWEVVGVAGV